VRPVPWVHLSRFRTANFWKLKLFPVWAGLGSRRWGASAELFPPNENTPRCDAASSPLTRTRMSYYRTSVIRRYIIIPANILSESKTGSCMRAEHGSTTARERAKVQE